ncbi:rhamnolipids biosynthesis 3-oxoacyl-reductase [Irpex rosettiformis]|uniref:Rhamnolipids biosynthesis 3-oxoacyl-reductase n=1 Tax=Irpex rosettiformis TaxID=378272 RepID=A0ACB8TP33_9APHY|nr:rhamnolipids biosynthesis 3-oxoacyl-reductase [Irpex rosettiformis]
MASEDLSVSNLYNIKGKVALVTGGGSGIGTMFASAYVQNGAKVYIASRKEKQLKEVADALDKKGPGSCHYIVADVSSKAGCDALAEELKRRESKLHILVNNSGATWGAPYNDVPEKEGWDRVMSLNVKGVFYLTVALTDLLAKDSDSFNPAHVINISSVAGLNTVATESGLASDGHGLWSYNTSKAAVNHLTSVLASTLSPRCITVNAVLPGIFPSKMTAFGYKTHGEKGMSSGTPMGRAGHPRDIAGIALFLGSSASAHITGAHIPIDGGALVGRVKAAL